MHLKYAPASPFARKVRAAAIELGLADRISLEAIAVVPGQKNQAYAEAINPLRKIPALVLEDNSVIVDSAVICEYLDHLAGGGRLIPSQGPERWRVLSRHAIADGMCEAAVLIRYETWLRPEPMRWPLWIDDQWDKIHSGLRWFEDRAELDSPESSSTLDLFQLALASCLGYLNFRFAEVDWVSRHPRIAAWFSEVSQRASLVQTRPEIPAS